MTSPAERSAPLRRPLAALGWVVLAFSVCLDGHGLAADGGQVFTPTAESHNVRVERGDRGVVNIYYDLVTGDPRATVEVSLLAAIDESGPFNLTPSSVSGDVGANVRPGTGKRIVWDASKDVERTDADLFHFRIRTTAAPLEIATGAPASNDRAAASRMAALSVVTNPPGARVLIDGRLRGASPLTLRDLPPGSHRLTIVVAGYLENSRMVEVAAGQAARVEVSLTKSVPGSPESSADGKKGGSTKWLIIGGVGAAGAGAALAGGGGSKAAPQATTPTSTTTTPPTTTPTVTNRPPTVACGDVLFGLNHVLRATDVGVVSATRYQFQVGVVSDPDADSVSYTVSFGNGATATGTYSATNNSTIYVFPAAGTFQPTLTVRDGRGGEAGCRYQSVVMATVTGEWIGNATTGTISSRLVLSQSGVNVTGNYYEDSRSTANSLQGIITNTTNGAKKDGTINLSVAGNFANQLTFSLEPGDDLRSYKGTYTYKGRSGTFEMKR